ncbi:hypothetical protein H2248_008041 [Termitomyces sp. 'cryptogamus']|nr:hypothetical protein H2248_008041 [Termitomyces sp. 'cryptogamus']
MLVCNDWTRHSRVCTSSPHSPYHLLSLLSVENWRFTVISSPWTTISIEFNPQCRNAACGLRVLPLIAESAVALMRRHSCPVIIYVHPTWSLITATQTCYK